MASKGRPYLRLEVEGFVVLIGKGDAENDRDRREGYSIILFGRHGHRFRHPPADHLARTTLIGRRRLSI